MEIARRLTVLAVLLCLSPVDSAAQISCYPGAAFPCFSLSTVIAVQTIGSEAFVEIDAVAPADVIVQQVVLRHLSGQRFLNGSSLYTFAGSFTGSFSLSERFELPLLPTPRDLIEEALRRARSQEDEVTRRLDQFRNLIDERIDELDDLEAELDACGANVQCIATVSPQITELNAELQALVQSFQLLNEDLDAIRDEIASLEANLAQTPPQDPVRATLTANDLTVDSWSGTRVVSVPEPGTLILLATGLLGLAGACGRHRNRED